MKVGAPGKVMLTGSYAVLEGAPAIVCAISRLAVAGGERKAPPSREVLAAMDEAEAPHVDVSELFSGAEKLGLGSSAAAVIAALGHHAAERGDDLSNADVRRALFDEARRAHARAQSGGSGVDIAASVYGGTLRYRLEGGVPSITAVSLPVGLHLDVYWSGHGVRTSDMRARVDALRSRAPAVFAARMEELALAAEGAAAAVEAGTLRGFIGAARAAERGLMALGQDADAPIVPLEACALVRAAEAEESAFLPSGAGGGDVFVRLGPDPASPRFEAAALGAGFERLALTIDVLGVRVIKQVGVPSS